MQSRGHERRSRRAATPACRRCIPAFGPRASHAPELLAGLLADGDEELAAWTLENALSETPRVHVYHGLVRDAMALTGRRWVDGTWGLAEEHVASGTLLRCLERIAPPLGRERRCGPGALPVAVAGERRTIGLVCAAHVL